MDNEEFEGGEEMQQQEQQEIFEGGEEGGYSPEQQL